MRKHVPGKGDGRHCKCHPEVVFTHSAGFMMMVTRETMLLTLVTTFLTFTEKT